MSEEASYINKKDDGGDAMKQMSNPALYKQLDQSAWLWTPPGAARKKFEAHDFAGYGAYNVRHKPRQSDMGRIVEELQVDHDSRILLQQLEATAISGNDILSSTFYVSGLVSLSSGILAPLCLALVGVVLYLFRGIYHETVMALPCNGGTYNILLNCTSKQFASMAAVFAIIAYITTGVVSALEAIAYLETVLPFEIERQAATIVLLAFFCVLTNMGLSESAKVAKAVFVIHVAVLSILTFMGLLHMICHPQRLIDNWSAATPSFPPVDMAGRIVPGTVYTALFYGFSSAMLGCSGFETSSQFVEEQAPGVFPKTLRNMWAGVMFFNPLLSLISFSCLTLDDIMEHHDTVLARTANVLGDWLQMNLHFPDQIDIGFAFSTIVSVDAFVVLAAALLTGYVGINGLIRRMSMDRCMPQFFLIQNPWTGTDSFILVGFFLLCVSQVVILDSDVSALGGVYCYAFLTVMTIFAYGNILLKFRRPSLPREVEVSWLHSVAGLVSVVVALMGNVLGKPELLTYFFVYFLIVGALVLVMFQRVAILRLLFKLLKPRRRITEEDSDVEGEDAPLVPKGQPIMQGDLETSGSLILRSNEANVGSVQDPPPPPPMSTSPSENVSCLQALGRTVRSVQQVPFVFFCKHDDLYMLNKAMLYIQKNEQTNKIIVVHCTDTNDKTDTSSLTEHVKLMDLLYPRVKISLLIVEGTFSPATVEWLSQALAVPINAMFISCPDENFTMKISQLRGMRIIFSYE